MNYSDYEQSQYKSIYGKEEPYKIFDFLFPGSNTAKLIRVFDAYQKNFPFKEILQRLNIASGQPILNLIGGRNGQNRNKLYAGIARACFNTDAIIIDNGISTGVEKHAMRKGIKLIGVAPENEVQNPKVNSTYSDPMELSAGHTHLFLINNQENDLRWTQEALFKITLALRLAEGDFIRNGLYQRVVHLLIGDGPHYIDEVRLAIKFEQPILIVPGSDLCDKIIQGIQSQDPNYEDIDEEMVEYLTQFPQFFFMLLDSSSDEVAQYIHFFLTVTPYKQKIPILYLSKQVSEQKNQQMQQIQSNNQSIYQEEQEQEQQLEDDQEQQQQQQDQGQEDDQQEQGQEDEEEDKEKQYQDKMKRLKEEEEQEEKEKMEQQQKQEQEQQQQKQQRSKQPSQLSQSKQKN